MAEKIAVNITTADQLKVEIYRLESLELEQGAALKLRFNGPGAIFSTVYSMFSKPAHAGGHSTNIFNQDFVSTISRFLIPLTLNNTLFKNSGFIIKALVGLISQKASGFVNEDSVVSVWDKVKGLFIKKSAKVDQRYPYGL